MADFAVGCRLGHYDGRAGLEVQQLQQQLLATLCGTDLLLQISAQEELLDQLMLEPLPFISDCVCDC
jgi:hypothetical protein